MCEELAKINEREKKEFISRLGAISVIIFALWWFISS